MATIESVRYQNSDQNSVVVTFAAEGDNPSYTQVTRVPVEGDGSRLWRLVNRWLGGANVIDDPPAVATVPSESAVIIKALIDNNVLTGPQIDAARAALR